MEQPERNKLLQARELIQEVRATMDLEFETCDGCGRNHYRDWPSMQMDKELGAISTKLQRFASAT